MPITTSSFFLPLLVILALSMGAPAVHGAVHTIDVTHHRLPNSHNISRRAVADGCKLRPNLEALRRHHQAEMDYYLHGKGTLPMFDVRAVASTLPVDVDYFYFSYYIVGNVSLGYPEQSFSVCFDAYSSQLYAIDVDDTYYSDSVVGNVTDKQAYDPTASSSCVLDVNGTFISNWAFENGSVASDELRVGDSLLTRVSFMGASMVNEWMQDLPCDGVFGLSLTSDQW